jgi:hypothetical protein
MFDDRIARERFSMKDYSLVRSYFTEWAGETRAGTGISVIRVYDSYAHSAQEDPVTVASQQ